ncbi:phage tail protein [Mesorhizobium cantuariense]|uniref:Phage tail protein n=1 Tax=Mesorhizobium cantuariense TaxID=1300275 RepID=A0ABV7MY27_9HYPH
MGFLVPLFVSIGSAITGAFSLLGGSTILAGLARFGLGLAAKYALGAMLAPKAQSQASQLDTTYGEDLARAVAMGKVGTAGHLIYRNAYSSGNRRVQDVYILSNFQINDITRVRYKGEWKMLGGTVDATKGRRIQGIDAEVWVKLYKGMMDQTADAGLIAKANPNGRWTTDHRGAGIAYAIVTNVLDREHLTQPWEAFFEIEGAPLYDWRLDTSVGGSGSHRWNDQTTWAFSENPVLMAYALERGIFNGTEMMVGKGASASRLPLANWSQAANICDENVGSGARYSAALIAAAGSGITHDQNLQPLLEASAASWIEDSAGEYPIAGAAQSIALTFTDDDIMVDEAFRFSTKRTKSELINTLAGTYLEPENFYEQTPLAVRIDDPALSVDGERLAVSVPYGAVNRSEVADRLADIAFKASRYQGNADITIHPKYLADANAGRWIEWDSAEYGTVTFQILEKRLGPLGDKGARNITLTLQEVSDGIFDPTAYETAPPDAIVPGVGDYQSELLNFQVAGIVSTSSTGSKRAGIRATWNDIEDVTITFVDIEYGPIAVTGDVPTERAHSSALANQTDQDMWEGVMSSSLWAVRYILRSSPPRTFFPSAWFEVDTLEARLGDADVYLPGLADQINQATAAQLAPLNVNIRDVISDARRVAREASNQDAGQYLDRLQSLTQVKSVYQTVTADYQLLVTAATGPGSAIVQRLETLEATIPGLATVLAVNSVQLSVSTLGTTVDAQGNTIASQGATITAQGVSISGLSASVGNISASSLFRTAVVATETGALATVGVSVAATAGGATSTAALLLSALAGGDSMLGLVASKIYMTDGTNKFSPFVFTAGVLYLENIVVGTLKFNQLSSNNGKLVIRGSGSLADISIFV